MRESSLTLPSSMGTLKSTRIRTRLPCGSKSRTVSFSMAQLSIWVWPGARAGSGSARAGLHGRGSRQALADIGDQIGHAARITPFVVVPRHVLDHVPEHDRVRGADDGRVVVALEVHGNEGLFGVIHDALQVALGGLLERRVDLFLGDLAAQDRGEVHDADRGRWHAEGHACEL